LAQSITTLWQQPETVETFAKEIERDYGSGKLSWKEIAEIIIFSYYSRYNNK
jgi:hypothetical protein